MLPTSEDVPGGATGLPGRVAQLYYTYGLFAASHPRLLSSLVLSVAIICRWVDGRRWHGCWSIDMGGGGQMVMVRSVFGRQYVRWASIHA